MSHTIVDDDKTCIYCCSKYFELGTDREIRFLLTSLKWLRIKETWDVHDMISLQQVNINNMKHIPYIWLSNFT